MVFRRAGVRAFVGQVSTRRFPAIGWRNGERQVETCPTRRFRFSSQQVWTCRPVGGLSGW